MIDIKDDKKAAKPSSPNVKDTATSLSTTPVSEVDFGKAGLPSNTNTSGSDPLSEKTVTLDPKDAGFVFLVHGEPVADLRLENVSYLATGGLASSNYTLSLANDLPNHTTPNVTIGHTDTDSLKYEPMVSATIA